MNMLKRRLFHLFATTSMACAFVLLGAATDAEARRGRRPPRHQRRPPPSAVPELDPTGAAAALGLVFSGAALVLGRRRERDEG